MIDIFWWIVIIFLFGIAAIVALGFVLVIAASIVMVIIPQSWYEDNPKCRGSVSYCQGDETCGKILVNGECPDTHQLSHHNWYWHDPFSFTAWLAVVLPLRLIIGTIKFPYKICTGGYDFSDKSCKWCDGNEFHGIHTSRVAYPTSYHEYERKYYDN